MSSMSAYDAANFGVKTLALCPNLKVNEKYSDWFLDLEAEGYLIKAFPDKDFIIDWIGVVEKVKPRFSTIGEEDGFDNAISRFISNFLIVQK